VIAALLVAVGAAVGAPNAVGSVVAGVGAAFCGGALAQVFWA
jgi:hypothetical protein